MKLCECGCGEPTNRITKNHKATGAVKGDFFRFVAGHYKRSPAALHERYTLDDLTGCWNWNGFKDSHGYGRVNIQGEHFAHRYVYQQTRGCIPVGMELDHLCCNRGCVNPDHLEPVTETTNIRRSTVAKLTAVQAREIRDLGSSPGAMRYQDIAVIYGISFQNVGHVVRGENWKEAV